MLGIQSVGTSVTLQLQQAQQRADQARQKAQSLQAEAETAQKTADQYQEKAQSIQYDAKDAQNNATVADQDLQSVKSLSQRKTLVITSVPAPAEPKKPYSNSLKPLVGATINTVA